MSTALKQKAPTLTQRSAEATRLAAELLGIDDVKRVAVAVAEAATEELRHNRTFMARVQALCEEMAPQPKVTQPRTATGRSDGNRSKQKAPRPKLIPLKEIEVEINPAAPPDPYFLLELYGLDQLSLALDDYDREPLLEVARSGAQPKSGTKLTARITKPKIIAYIVEQVTQAR